MCTLSSDEKDFLLRIFINNGNVLDFSRSKFDAFTQDVIGVALCQKYPSLSKGAALKKYTNEAPSTDVFKLFKALLEHYELFCKDSFSYSNDVWIEDGSWEKVEAILNQMSNSASESSTVVSMNFNLIIRSDEAYPMDSSRMLEGTDEHVAALFRSQNGQINFEKLSSLPTITTPEFKKGDLTARAKLGYLKPAFSLNQLLNVEMPSDSILFDFPAMKLFDSGILNTANEFAAHRTRWLVEEGDPYRLLSAVGLKEKADSIPGNLNVLHFPDCSPEIKVAVMMPFNNDYPTPDDDPVYKAIKSAVIPKGLSCTRVDEIFGPRDINHDILKLIQSSWIVIADLTGQNPNVFYEMGLAHARERIVIPIKGDESSLAFDIGHLRTIKYNKSDSWSLKGLTANLSKTLDDVLTSLHG